MYIRDPQADSTIDFSQILANKNICEIIKKMYSDIKI